MDEMAQFRISIWHVGSRGGYSPFEIPEPLLDIFSFTFFDHPSASPDADIPCYNNNRFFGQIFWKERTRLPFFQTRCPFAAGLKKLRPRFEDWYVFGNPNLDYVLGHACEVVSTEDVETSTIDIYSSRADQQTFLPSVLLIDAQGSSTEILLGAKETLKDQIDFVVAEVELLPLFEDTPSFVAILPYLTNENFLFARFLDEQNPWASPVRRPVGQRSRALMGSADAVFIRDPAEVVRSKNAPRMGNYVACCLVLGFVEEACFVAHELDRMAAETIEEPGLSNLLAELFVSLRHMPSLYGKTLLENSNNSIDELVFLNEESSSLEQFLDRWGMPALSADIKYRRNEQVSVLMRRK